MQNDRLDHAGCHGDWYAAAQRNLFKRVIGQLHHCRPILVVGLTAGIRKVLIVTAEAEKSFRRNVEGIDHPPRCAGSDPSPSAATAARTRCSSRAEPTSRSRGVRLTAVARSSKARF